MKAEITLKYRMAQADLLCATVELSTYAMKGAPPVLRPYLSEPPQATLSRVLRAVEPSDLSGGATYLWARAQALAADGRRITWDALLSSAPEESRNFAAWCRTYGLAVAYQALAAAERVTAWAIAARTINEAQEQLAAGIEAAEASVSGVAGVG